MNDKIQDIDFCCQECLFNDMLNRLDFDIPHNDLVIVGDKYLINDLLKLVSKCEVDGESFNYMLLDFDTEDYDDLYYFSINTDMEIYVEKAWHEDNEYRKADYLFTDADYIYIQADCNSKILRKLDTGENNIIIFDFKED